ncbi:MAG: SOS response-associated peptidase [Pseudomonadota bacterium]
MCGRFAVTLPSDAMAQLFEASPANALPDIPNYNICPTNQIHTVISTNGARQLISARWGFLPHWYKAPSDTPLLINARAETIAEKPAFRDAARHRRCLIPVTGFYEWTKDEDGQRLPWYFAPTGCDTMAFAGIWQDWTKGEDPIRSCAIVTTSANAKLQAIHHRMPVILAQQDWPMWLGEAGHGAATLMRAAPEDTLSFYRVDPEVNSNRAFGSQLIDPIPLSLC